MRRDAILLFGTLIAAAIGVAATFHVIMSCA